MPNAWRKGLRETFTLTHSSFYSASIHTCFHRQHKAPPWKLIARAHRCHVVTSCMPAARLAGTIQLLHVVRLYGTFEGWNVVVPGTSCVQVLRATNLAMRLSIAHHCYTQLYHSTFYCHTATAPSRLCCASWPYVRQIPAGAHIDSTPE